MRALTLLLSGCALLVAAEPAYAQPQTRSQRNCIRAVQQGFERVALAQRRAIQNCARLGTIGRLGAETIEDCLTADGDGRIARAQQITLEREALRCIETPDFGYTEGTIANAEAVAAELRVVHELFGPDLDAVLVEPASDADAARCQTELLRRAGQCSREFLRSFGRCSQRALGRGGASEAFDGIVACKGADERGRIASACDTRLTAGIARRCQGQDVDALFPGCAGLDLGSCARGHALAGPNDGVNASAGVCGPDPSIPAPPAPEPISIADVPMPAGVTLPSELTSMQYTKDGSRILFSMQTTAVGGTHLATIAEDGSDFECLTCSLGPGTFLVQAHPATDGSRVAVRSGTGLQRHSVVECSPSVVDCQTVEVVPVEIPTFGAPILRHAQMRISPDNQHMLYTQIRTDGGLAVVMGELVRQVDHYDVLSPRALTAFRPIFSGPPGNLTLEAVGDWGEAKGFADGGASVNYYSTFDSLNFDAAKMDLATGAKTRLTRHPEYDEDHQQSPDGQWYEVNGYRNHDRMAVFSQVPRPPIADPFIRNALALLRNTASGRRFFDLFLQDPYGSRDGYTGQQLNLPNDLDWASRGNQGWHPDGTRIVFLEQLNPDLGTPTTVMRVVTLTSRSPTVPLPIVPSPEPTWALPLEDLTGLSENTTGTLLGAVAGRTDVSFQLANAPFSSNGDVQIEYVDYSSDGRTILNGTEVANATGLNVEWDAEVRLSGCDQGFLAADVSFVTFPASATGTIASEVGGKLVEGLPER